MGYDQTVGRQPCDNLIVYIFINKRQRNLFGWFLLNKSWQSVFNESLNLGNIETSEFNRPYVPGSSADFNISHSGDYVVCILSPNSRVGIDIEYKQKVDLNDFTRTMKESVIKADGRGLSIPLTDIIFEKNKVYYDGVLWYLHPFKIDSNHPGCVASNTETKDLNLVEVHWTEFLSE